MKHEAPYCSALDLLKKETPNNLQILFEINASCLITKLSLTFNMLIGSDYKALPQSANEFSKLKVHVPVSNEVDPVLSTQLGKNIQL